MNSERDFYNQPIRSLQTMLRTIGQFSDHYEPIVPDGIYGPETQAAVSTFQRNRGLPVTGITNRQTWDEIVRIYDLAAQELHAVRPIDGGRDDFPYVHGNESARLKLAQCMLCELASLHGCVCPPEITGKMDALMVNSISEFQRLNGLPVNGTLDKVTWNHLVHQYAMAERKTHREDSSIPEKP